MDPNAAHFYELRRRLRKSLAQHHWERGKVPSVPQRMEGTQFLVPVLGFHYVF